jgi:serine/threonine-protein kinase RsbW
MKRELEFASHPGNLSLMRDFVREFLQNVEIASIEKDLIVLGLDEACTNVIRYAYHHEPDQLMVLSCERKNEGVVFRLRDYGTPCEAARLQGRPLELVQPGGLGIHLIRRAFDEVDYRQQKDGTELVLTRKCCVDGHPS